MIRFTSSATGDVLMLDAHGRQLLALIGRDDPTRGVIMPAQMGDAILRLQAADLDAPSPDDDVMPDEDSAAGTGSEAIEPVTMAQRAFPLLQMLKRARTADRPIMWGV